MLSSSFAPQFYRWCGSLKLAVVTLSVLTVVLITATIYESETSTRQVQVVVYQSWWFLALLSLLALNVFCSAMARYPWKKTQTGFVITHSGILVLLGGAIVGLLFGIEGHVTLAEGGPPVSLLNRDYEILQVTRRDSGLAVLIPLDLDRRPLGPGETRLLRARNLPLAIGLKARHANTREELVIKDGGTEVNAALRFTFSSAMGGTGTNPMQVSEWLVAQDNQRQSVALGPAVFRIENIPSADLLRQRLSPPSQEAAAGKGVLTIVAKQQTLVVPVEQYLGKIFRSPEGPITIAIKDYFADFRMDTESRKPTSVSDVPNNPAVAFEVGLPEGHAAGFAFADFPEMGIMRSDTLPANVVQATYVYERSGSGLMSQRPTSTFTVLAGPDNQLHYVSRSSGTNFQTGELKVGQRVPLNWKLPAEVKVEEFYPRPQITTRAVPATVEPGENFSRPALELQLGQTRQRQEVMLRWGERHAVSVGGTAYDLMYGLGTTPLSFSIQLEKFSAPKFEGTTMPAGFESAVKVSDLTTGNSLEQKIWMNNPLTYGGYRISQASYQESSDGAPTQSTLQLLHDPGWPLKWIGSLLIIAGIAIMFYYQPQNHERMVLSNEIGKINEKRRRREAVASVRTN